MISKKDQMLHIIIPKDLYKHIKKNALENRVTIGTYMRILLKDFFKYPKNVKIRKRRIDGKPKKIKINFTKCLK